MQSAERRSAWLGCWTSVGCVRNREAYIAGWGGGKDFLLRKRRDQQESFDSISGMRLLVLLLTSALALAQRTPGSPLDHLPPNIEVLTHFGERADISPDNQRVAFMTKSFGDAMVVDLKSRVIQCLTCNVPGRRLSAGDASGDRGLHPDRSRPLRESVNDPLMAGSTREDGIAFGGRMSGAR